MDLRDYLRILRKRWRLVALCTLLGLAGAAVATIVATPQYSATARLFISARSGEDISSALQGGNFTQQRVKSYADVVTTAPVMKAVIDKLGLDTTPTELADEISVDNPLDTVLLNVTATDKSPEQATAIANSVAAQFTDVVRKLETPDGGGQPLVKATVVQQAAPPVAPVSPRPKINLALGLLVGLAIGVGVSVLRETLDTTVRSTEEVKEHTGAPLLGVVPEDPSTPRRPLVVEDPSTKNPRSEAYRQIRTNLQFLDVNTRLRTIVVTSAMPGEGKTTTVCNLAIAMAESGRRVILVEADLRRPRTADYFGLEGGVGVVNALLGQAEVEDLLQPWGRLPLEILPSGPIPPNPSELLGSQAMTDLINRLSARADVVLLDAPPLLPVTDASVLAAKEDGALLVTRHGFTRRDQLEAAAESLSQVGAKLLGTVVNRIPAKTGKYGYGYGYSYDYDYGTDANRPRLGGGAPGRTSYDTARRERIGADGSANGHAVDGASGGERESRLRRAAGRHR